ncbi:MAG: hypothetical protein M3135_07770, partial [Actinomycetota bacterium]|nr:hypothetical protein [Actinomycetota bacterium]
MEQGRPPQVASISGFLALLGYVIGSGLVILGAISWGFQLILMPLGLSLLVLAAGRHEPRLAGALSAGSMGIAITSWLSYSLGIAETIFQPHPLLLIPVVSLLAFLGYLAGRGIETVQRKSTDRKAAPTS